MTGGNVKAAPKYFGATRPPEFETALTSEVAGGEALVFVFYRNASGLFAAVEGGPKVAASFLRADLVDEAVLLHGPITIGADGLDALDGLPLAALTESARLRPTGTETVGGDSLERYERR